jgi:hypothetical protein
VPPVVTLAGGMAGGTLSARDLAEQASAPSAVNLTERLEHITDCGSPTSDDSYGMPCAEGPALREEHAFTLGLPDARSQKGEG